MENIFGKIYEAIYANKKILLEGELLIEAEKLWEVKNGVWTPEQKKRFGQELKGWKQGAATLPDKVTLFMKLEALLDLNKKQSQIDGITYHYRAKCNCVVNGVYRREGDIIISEKKLEVPHFEPEED